MNLDRITPPLPVSIDAARARRAEQPARAPSGPGDGSPTPAGGVQPSVDGDTVSVSGAARSLARAGAAVSAAPDERAPLVGRLRAEVLSGEYQLDAQDLARTLIDRGLV